MAGVSAAATVDDESDGVVHRNPIWNYFLKIRPGTSARCIKCEAILKTPTGTTTTLVSHLKRHPDAYQAYMEERQARTNTAKLKSVSTPSQPSVADSFKQKMKPTGPRAKHMTKMIANFIARGMHPYSVVEEGGFVDMVAFAMPDYSVPSRTTFSRAVIPNLYESKKTEVKRKLREIFSRGAECYSLTTDGWTSRANDSYVCLTVHVMDKDFGAAFISLLHCTRLVLTQHSTVEAASLASSLLRSIGPRFPDFKMLRLPALAMLVDPSTGLGYLPEDSVWGVFSSLSSASCRKTGQQGADEAAEYLKSPLLARTEDPLVSVARRYLSIPATQTTSESLFSSAGAIVNCRRELLLPDHVQQLVFLHENA
ncbi:hypothetical protein HPB47_010333 [Ixodes persulcatus]|uniref:Uncharacterized protein n=1 Tax=Ixodes persulcatus TaxID=34615 RepID=A0AC60NZR4_IXOPE|nr:hypothetical protein HPB47_010333 [Ixodes persulcatus]